MKAFAAMREGGSMRSQGAAKVRVTAPGRRICADPVSAEARSGRPHPQAAVHSVERPARHAMVAGGDIRGPDVTINSSPAALSSRPKCSASKPMSPRPPASGMRRWLLREPRSTTPSKIIDISQYWHPIAEPPTIVATMRPSASDASRLTRARKCEPQCRSPIRRKDRRPSAACRYCMDPARRGASRNRPY